MAGIRREKRTPLIPALPQQPATHGCAPGKKFNDRIQGIVAENWPMNFLASPDILLGPKNSIAHIHPDVLEPYVLWNLEQLCFRNGAENPSR